MYVVKQNFCCSLQFITRLFNVEVREREGGMGERERGWDGRDRERENQLSFAGKESEKRQELRK